MKRVFSIMALLLTFVASMQAKDYDWDIESNKQKASNGDVWAKAYLAVCYFTGDRVAKNWQTAQVYAQQCSSESGVAALVHAATLARLGENNATLFQTVRTKLLKEAENDAVAQFMWGSVLTGAIQIGGNVNIPVDINRGIQFFEKAEKQGYAPAAIELATFCLEKGDYTDVDRGLSLLSKYTEKGSKKAIALLLKVYSQDGWAVPKDPSKFFEWSLKFAKQGDVGSMFDTGRNYLIGFGVEKNAKEAYKWFKQYESRVTGNNLAEVQQILADFDENGDYIQGLHQYTGSAADYYKRSLNGDIEAKFQLAMCYKNGEGVKKDESKAYTLLQEAAQRGNQQAKTELEALKQTQQARIDAEQRDRAQNPEKYDKPKFYAAKWRAINNDDLQMMLQIANIYERGDNSAMYEGIKGEHIDKNLDSALVMCQRRLDASIRKLGHGGDNASYIVNLYMKMGKKDKALAFMKECADKGNATPNVALDLGYCYYHGYNVQQNYNLALKYLKQAAQQETDESVANAANAILGLMYFYGRGVAKNPAQAFKCWRGDPSDEFNGYYRMNALNTTNITRSLLPTTDYDKEYGFLTSTECEVTITDKAQCFHAYGVCYEKGYGTTAQLEYAAKMWLKGTAESNYKLGYYFENGRLGATLWRPERLGIARDYYRKAANAGHQQAKAALRRLGN